MKVKGIIHAAITVVTKQYSKTTEFYWKESPTQGNADKNCPSPDTVWLQVFKVRDASIFCLFAPPLSLSYSVNVILMSLLLYRFCRIKFYLVITFQKLTAVMKGNHILIKENCLFLETGATAAPKVNALV